MYVLLEMVTFNCHVSFVAGKSQDLLLPPKFFSKNQALHGKIGPLKIDRYTLED